jgi:hypothetical protein
MKDYEHQDESDYLGWRDDLVDWCSEGLSSLRRWLSRGLARLDRAKVARAATTGRQLAQEERLARASTFATNVVSLRPFPANRSNEIQNAAENPSQANSSNSRAPLNAPTSGNVFV